MPTFINETTLTANQVVANIMAGSQFEFVQRPTRVQVYSLAEAGDTVDMQVFFGQELQMALSRLGVGAAAGAGPVVPDDLLIDDIAAPLDRLTIGVNEATGLAAGIVRTRVVLTPVA